MCDLRRLPRGCKPTLEEQRYTLCILVSGMNVYMSKHCRYSECEALVNPQCRTNAQIGTATRVV